MNCDAIARWAWKIRDRFRRNWGGTRMTPQDGFDELMDNFAEFERTLDWDAFSMAQKRAWDKIRRHGHEREVLRMTREWQQWKWPA